MYACMYVCMYVFIYVFMYFCIYVFIYLFVCLFTYMHILTHTHPYIMVVTAPTQNEREEQSEGAGVVLSFFEISLGGIGL